MKNRGFYRVTMLWMAFLAVSCSGKAEREGGEESARFEPKKVIFEHLGDEYGWNVGHAHIPLPVIVRGEGGGWHLFSSARLLNGGAWEGFRLSHEGKYAGKVVEVTADGTEYRPWDFSVTKNAFALMICAVVLCALLFPLVRWYRRKPFTAPRRLRGMLEAVVEMLYRDVLVPMLGKDARRYAPYLLTLFFFILVANLMGLMVVFPGGANHPLAVSLSNDAQEFPLFHLLLFNEVFGLQGLLSQLL